MEFDQEIIDVFVEEFGDLIDILKREIMSAEENNKACNIKEIFRVFHTLKGNSATLEFNRLHKLSHEYCEHFRVRQAGKTITFLEISALKKCVKILNQFMSSAKNGKKGKRIKISAIIKSINQ